MARRRVFQTTVECSDINADICIAANKAAIVGRTVTLDKTESTVAVSLDGSVLGRLGDAIGIQVSSAMARGQSFTAVIKNAYQNYDKNPAEHSFPSS